MKVPGTELEIRDRLYSGDNITVNSVSLKNIVKAIKMVNKGKTLTCFQCNQTLLTDRHRVGP